MFNQEVFMSFKIYLFIKLLAVSRIVKWFEPSIEEERFLKQRLSPPQRPLCVVGGLGRKKKRTRGARWEGKERREASAT